MYLFVYRDGTFKQVSENLTAVDLVASQTNVLTIFKFGPALGFHVLTVLDGQLSWVKVKEADDLITVGSRLHH